MWKIGLACLFLMAAHLPGQAQRRAVKKPVKKAVKKPAPVVRKKAPVRQPAAAITAALPVLSDSLLEKDVPIANFDSIILAKRRQQRNFNSPEFDLGKTLGSALENFLPVQFKYAILLNQSVEKLTNLVLYRNIDDWYGTRYRYGGQSARGIDCSAFMQVLSQYTYGWSLPRTAREQFRMMTPIKREELQEGDFVFFNTTGGISHVGMYLQNNKFIHSSSSRGVSVGDLNSQYWSRRFLGARRMPAAPPPAQ